MIDMNKEIIFRDGWSLEGDRFDDFLKARAIECIALGYKYGLKLDEFFYDSEMVHFEWRGTKRAIAAWYIDYSVNMTYEPADRRNATLEIIRDK